MLLTFTVKTNERTEMIDITRLIEAEVEKTGIRNGLCTVFIPHTTAAVTINENADPDVTRDILMEMNKTIPFNDGYKHYEGNSAAHIKASLFGFSEHIIVESGSLVLGTWQGVYLCEFDGGRTRKVLIKLVEG